MLKKNEHIGGMPLLKRQFHEIGIAKNLKIFHMYVWPIRFSLLAIVLHTEFFCKFQYHAIDQNYEGVSDYLLIIYNCLTREGKRGLFRVYSHEVNI